MSPSFEDLEMICTESGRSVSRFAELVGVPRRTCHARLARLRAGDLSKGRIEPDVAKYAEAWLAWGCRKIAAIADSPPERTLTHVRTRHRSPHRLELQSWHTVSSFQSCWTAGRIGMAAVRGVDEQGSWRKSGVRPSRCHRA